MPLLMEGVARREYMLNIYRGCLGFPAFTILEQDIDLQMLDTHTLISNIYLSTSARQILRVGSEGTQVGKINLM
jgi:hypothetical protein